MPSTICKKTGLSVGHFLLSHPMELVITKYIISCGRQMPSIYRAMAKVERLPQL